MNYLIYIEHAAENLQFFLWYKDYLKRFDQLPANEQALAPTWRAEHVEAEANQSSALSKKHISPEAAAAFKGTGFAPPVASVTEVVRGNPFNTPPRTPLGERESINPSEKAWSDNGSTLNMSHPTGGSHQKSAAGAFEGADVKWQPCEHDSIGGLEDCCYVLIPGSVTIQPFRDEVSRIIAIYIADGGPRQLNLSSKERNTLLHALVNTTHPTAFRAVVHTVEWSLRHQAHPNFIRWTICNGNRPRVIFARALGVGGILGGMVAAIIITLSGAGRGWRVLSACLFLFGISTLIAAWKGMCVVSRLPVY